MNFSINRKEDVKPIEILNLNHSPHVIGKMITIIGSIILITQCNASIVIYDYLTSMLPDELHPLIQYFLISLALCITGFSMVKAVKSFNKRDILTTVYWTLLIPIAFFVLFGSAISTNFIKLFIMSVMILLMLTFFVASGFFVFSYVFLLIFLFKFQDDYKGL